MRAGRAWRAALLPWLLAVAPAAAVAQDCTAVTPLTAATRTIAGPDGQQQARVAVPDRMPLSARREQVRVSYRIDVSACAASPSAALWVYRAGAPYQVSAGGQPLQLLNPRAMLSPALPAAAALPDVHNGRVPALFALPPGTREVSLELQTLPYFQTGLVRSDLGPTQTLLTVQAQAAEQAVAAMEAAGTTLLALALLAAMLWMPRRSDRSLLWLAVTCALWGSRGLLFTGHKVYVDPLLYEQYNSLNVALSSSALLACLLHVLGGMGERERRWVVAFPLAATLAFVLAAAAGQGAVLVRVLCLVGSFVLVNWVLVRAWQRRRQAAPWVSATLVGGMAILNGSGLHDLLLLGGTRPPDAPSYVFWGFVILLLGLSAVCAHYVVLTLNRAERSNAELARHVAERERLLRDMHDGLGSQLMTALRGVERGALATPQVAQSLQDSLDELRLLMDSADADDSLTGVLAAWRNRWDARLAAAGVTLDWRMDDALDGVQLDGETALQLMRILQEAAANVVKHAQASRLALDAARHGDTLRIVVADDGAGLPEGPARAGARGLKNMHHRAGLIGASLTVSRRAPPQAGTQVTLELPLAAAQATSPRRAASIAASARDEMPSLR